MAMRNREYNHVKECEWCGAIFHTSRYDTRFCTAAHRAKHHRAELKRTKQYERIKQSISELLNDAPLEQVDMLIADICGYASGWSVKTVG